jgi:hypothetical protein
MNPKRINMKYQHKLNRLIPLTGLFVIAMGWWSCKVEPIIDPNNPGTNVITQNATLNEIQNLVVGTESGMRNNLATYLDDVSVIGREYYRFSSSDPRLTGDLLGKGGATLDNNTFYITNPFSARYRVVKNTNILIQALQNTKADFPDAQRKAGIAYAKTVQAHELLMNLNLLYDNGIRVDVADPDKLGPFLPRKESLDYIQNLLNDANNDLKGNPVVLPFHTTLYNDTASNFSKFNRALAARVAVYRQDWTTASAALSESFLSLTGSLTNGSYYLFSTGGGDLLNPVFFPRNSNGETRVTQPSFITDAAPNDPRLAKAPKRTSTATQDALNSDYDFFAYPTNVTPIPVIRNEELVLLYAEVKVQQNSFPDAIVAINRIRTAYGLPAYAGAITKDALITEILNQRRYSLFGEGHRWIDMRRYGLLGTLPIDRAGDDVWTQFPIPATENQ